MGNDWVWGLIGIGCVIFLYVRAYLAVIRIEKATREAADTLKLLSMTRQSQPPAGAYDYLR